MAQQIASLYAEVTADTSDLERGLNRARNSLEQTGDAAKKGGMRFTELQSQLNLARQAFGTVATVANQVWETIGRGAELDLARNRLDNLSVSIGTTSDALLNDLGNATGGMMSNAEQIASASQIISLGLADNQKDVVDLASLVSKLGWDMQQVILTFANNSKARLDALGLSVTDVEQRAKALEAQGYNTDKAFDLAVIQAGQAKLELLGDAAQTTAGQIKAIESAYKDMQDEFARGVAEGAAEDVSALAVASATGSDAVSELSNSMGRELIPSLLDTLGLSENLRLSLLLLVKRDLEAKDANVELTKAQKDVNWSLNEITPGFDDAATAAEFYAQAAMHTADGQRAGYRAAKEYEAQLRATTRALHEGYGLEAQYANQAQLVAQQTYNAGLRAQYQTAQQDALNDQLNASFINFSNNEDAMKQYQAIMEGVRDVTYQTGGRTAEQQGALEDLQKAYERAQNTITDYQIGARGAGMSQDEINEKVQEQVDLMGQLQSRMDPLLAMQGEYVSGTDGGKAATDAMNKALYDQIAATTDDRETLALAGVALGQFTEDQANAMLKAALLEEFIRKQATAFAEGRISIEEAQTAIQNFIGDLERMPSLVETEVRTNYTSTGTPSAVTGGAGTSGNAPGPTGYEAAGGPVTAGNTYMVGERGPEMFVPSTNGSIVPNGKMGATVNVYVMGAMAANPQAIASAVSKALTPRG